MSQKSNNGGGGIGFVGMLTVLFVGLKLTGFIDWSWWWVVSPVWISLSTGLIMIVLIAVFEPTASDKKNKTSDG